MSIEERAYLAYNEYTELGIPKRNAYIKGAIEQKNIDIRRAVDKMEKILSMPAMEFFSKKDIPFILDELKRAIKDE